MTTVGLFANEHRNSTKNLAPRMLLACIFFLSVHITAFGEQSPNQAAAVQNAITLQKAADAGNSDAMNNLGTLYAHGQGVAQDYGKAREWYQKAADAGNPAAMNFLGALYAHGQGVAQDYGKAREWFQKAADAGNTTAMDNLGGLYEGGKGVAQDHAKALEWFQKSFDARQHLR